MSFRAALSRARFREPKPALFAPRRGGCGIPKRKGTAHSALLCILAPRMGRSAIESREYQTAGTAPLAHKNLLVLTSLGPDVQPHPPAQSPSWHEPSRIPASSIHRIARLSLLLHTYVQSFLDPPSRVQG